MGSLENRILKTSDEPGMVPGLNYKARQCLKTKQKAKKKTSDVPKQPPLDFPYQLSSVILIVLDLENFLETLIHC